MINGIVQYYGKIKMFNREAKLFLIATFAIHLLHGAHQVIYNLYLSSLGYQSDFIGSVNSFKLLVGAIVAIPLGITISRVGYKKTLMFTGFLTFFSVIGIASVSTKPSIFLFSTLYGIAFVLYGIMDAPFLARFSSSEDRSHLFGVNFSLHMWSAMLGSFFGGSITQGFQKMFPHYVSYRYTLYIFSFFALVSLVPIFFLKKDVISQKHTSISETLKNVKKVAHLRDVRCLVIYSTMIGIGAGLVVPLFNIFLRFRLQATDFQIGTLISLTQIATSLGGLLTPFMVMAVGQSKSIVVSQMISIPFLFVIGYVPYFSIVSVAYLIRSSLMNMVTPIVDSISMQVVSQENRPTANSILRTVRSLGRSFGVYLSGIIMAGGNFLLPYILTCILYVGGSLVLYYSFVAKPESNTNQAQTAV